MGLLFTRCPDGCPACVAALERAQLNKLERRKAEEQKALVRQIIAGQRERLEALAERAQEPHSVPMPALVTLDGDISDGTLTIVRPKRKRTKRDRFHTAIDVEMAHEEANRMNDP